MRGWREELDDGMKGAIAAFHEQRPTRKRRVGKEIVRKMQEGLSLGRDIAIMSQPKDNQHISNRRIRS